MTSLKIAHAVDRFTHIVVLDENLPSKAFDNAPLDVSRLLMLSINLRQLRDTRRLKTWLRAGKSVELRERDRVIARIVPENNTNESPKWPDFEARAKAVFGGKIFPGSDLVISERGRF